MTSYFDIHANASNHNTNSSSSAAAAAAPIVAAPKKLIDYRLKANYNLVPRFIFECAVKLNMKPLTSATAEIILHRFNREVESENYDDFVSSSLRSDSV